MRKFKNKENINSLLLIDNIFGDYDGRVMPIILTIILAGIPPLLWLFFLWLTFIKFWYVLVFDLFWTIRWAMKLIGKEDSEKIPFYLQQKTDAYKSADEIIHIAHIHEDGLIEYDNGKVAYLVSGYPKSYTNDDKFSVDLEIFLNELDSWDWDMYLHNTVDEILCEDGLPNLVKYTDDVVIKERMSFYAYQDEWSRTNTGLYRITFLVLGYKYNWKKLKSHLQELISSDTSRVFNNIEILRYDKTNEIMNRDICGYIELRKMLMRKYDNEDYYNSKVLWFDDQIPKELIPKKEESSLEERRVN